MAPPLLLLLLLLPAAPLSASASLHPLDAAVLRDIRRTLRDGPGGSFFASWASLNPCAHFDGVLCASDAAGMLRVTVLTLGTGLAGSPGLVGTLPPSLGALTALTDLVLYPGRVSGTIPASLGVGLRRLRLLSMSGNLLSGAIPPSLSSLPELHTLDLSNNRLVGDIPPSLLLPLPPSLRVLILKGNGNLSGEIPPGFASSQLFHLDLADNDVGGELPPLPQTLAYISLARNAMRGALAGAFPSDASPPELAFVDLSMNGFSGPVPPAIFAMPSLTTILLDRNNLSGELVVPAATLGAPPQWSVIDVSHNAISGDVPEALASARSLILNNNRLSGHVPAAVAASVAAGTMATFYAQHNFLTGFPEPTSPLPESSALCLSYNCMALTSAAAAGCPTSGGPRQPRPAEQCGCS